MEEDENALLSLGYGCKLGNHGNAVQVLSAVHSLASPQTASSFHCADRADCRDCFPAYFRYEPGTIWENGKIVEFNEKGFRWNIDNKEFFFPENPQVYVAGYVSALTPNPKIHRVKIELIGSISDPEKFYSYPEHRKLREGRLVHAHNNGDKYPEYSPTTDFEALGDWYLEDQIGKIISYYTIEFTNQNSKQLSEFLNPLKEEHQRQVGLLTESWINPRMEWIGLKVKFRRFVLQ